MQSRPFSRHAGSAGYHFIDLLIGAAMTLMLLMLAVSSYAGLAGEQTLKFETRRLKAVLEQLSIDALQSEKDIVLELEERGYAAKKGDEHGPLLLKHRLKPPVRIKAAPRGEWRLTLFASGVSTPAAIVFSDDKEQCRVVLSLRSRVTMRCG